MADNSSGPRVTLSVVIPSYNSAPWLPSTVEALVRSLASADCSPEIIVVDDGSTDGTVAVLKELGRTSPFPLKVISQENKGRFHARLAGVRAAACDDILLLDSRLLMDEDAVNYLLRRRHDEAEVGPWNGHVVTDPSAPLVGHFWSVPTYLFWGSYLASPSPTLISLDNFDRVPKGTGLLFLERHLFEQACSVAWPEANAHLASDDTKLLRFIAGVAPMRLDPGFSGTYRPRTTIKQFLSHSWQRGTLFVDSYAGTSAIRNLILVVLALTPVVAVTAVVALAWNTQWLALAAGVVVAAAGLTAPLLIAAARRCPARALRAYTAFVFPFGIAFTAGLLRGLVVHRRSFRLAPRANTDQEVTK